MPPAIDRKTLNEFGRSWVKFIKEEALKDAAKSTFIPRSRAFYESFSYRVSTQGVVTIVSTWPWLELITEGTRGPYKMTWLTKQKGANVIPLAQADGRIAFRTVPRTVGQAWIHPKIAKHTFIARAFERAVAENIDGVLNEVLNAATNER